MLQVRLGLPDRRQCLHVLVSREYLQWSGSQRSLPINGMHCMFDLALRLCVFSNDQYRAQRHVQHVGQGLRYRVGWQHR